jgi:RNA polymerase sigma-70 factor, ECF subfamily
VAVDDDRQNLTRVESPEQLDPRTDQQLIAAINGGDAAAFEVLYFRYRDWVVNLAHRFTGAEDLALDVMQETFLYLLRKFPGFRLTANLKTFLYPAIRNLSLTARRKAGRYQSTEAEQLALEQSAVNPPLPGQAGDLATALGALSEEHREVLLLRFMDGLALAEIADAVDAPLGTVKSRLHHALASLRQDQRAKQFFEE